jgi:glycosyltransferase involved in cell wall biosynthesis
MFEVDVSLESTPRLSLIMPMYNENSTILQIIEKVLSQQFVAELIIVDDGSTDGSGVLLDSIRDPRVKIPRHAGNRGKGAALRTGISQATSLYVGIQDADLEYNPNDLRRLLRPLDEGLADVVFGSRFLTSDAHRVLFYWHSVGNKMLTCASNAVSNLNLSDMETCYKVFHREWIQSISIQENRFGFEPEITIKMAKRGARIYEVGVSYAGRNYQDGKKINWKDGVSAAWCIAKYGWLERRGSSKSN